MRKHGNLGNVLPIKGTHRRAFQSKVLVLPFFVADKKIPTSNSKKSQGDALCLEQTKPIPRRCRDRLNRDGDGFVIKSQQNT